MIITSAIVGYFTGSFFLTSLICQFGYHVLFNSVTIAIVKNIINETVNKINELNERMYRTDWINLYGNGSSPNRANETMEEIKRDAMNIIERMRNDIKKSTKFELKDIVPIFRGDRSNKRKSK